MFTHATRPGETVSVKHLGGNGYRFLGGSFEGREAVESNGVLTCAGCQWQGRIFTGVAKERLGLSPTASNLIAADVAEERGQTELAEILRNN